MSLEPVLTLLQGLAGGRAATPQADAGAGAAATGDADATALDFAAVVAQLSNAGGQGEDGQAPSTADERLLPNQWRDTIDPINSSGNMLLEGFVVSPAATGANASFHAALSAQLLATQNPAPATGETEMTAETAINPASSALTALIQQSTANAPTINATTDTATSEQPAAGDEAEPAQGEELTEDVQLDLSWMMAAVQPQAGPVQPPQDLSLDAQAGTLAPETALPAPAQPVNAPAPLAQESSPSDENAQGEDEQTPVQPRDIADKPLARGAREEATSRREEQGDSDSPEPRAASTDRPATADKPASTDRAATNAPAASTVLRAEGATATSGTSSSAAGPAALAPALSGGSDAAPAQRAEVTVRVPADGSLAQTVGAHIAKHSSEGKTEFTLRMDPEDLGRIDVKLEMGHDKTVRAVVSADNPQTLDLLQRDSRALERALADAGLKTDSGSLSFAGRDAGGSEGRQQQEQSAGNGRWLGLNDEQSGAQASAATPQSSSPNRPGSSLRKLDLMA